MGVASPARSVALDLLGRQRRRSARARDLLRGAHEMRKLGTKGRALATRLVLGVNVAAGELDRRIDAVVAKPGSLEPRVRDALRVAAFELLYLDTPRQVVVSQGVELVRGVQPRAARMANAVLRRVSERRAEVDAARDAVRMAAAGEATEVTAEQLAVASGYPSWLCERLLTELGTRDAAELAACALEAAPVYAAAVEGAPDAERVEGLLAEAGLEPEATGLPASWRLGAPAGLAPSGLIASCDVAASDLAAQLVCRIAGVGEGRMLEVGQGRGTKSLLLMSLASELSGRAGSLELAGVDVVSSKVTVCRERMATAGLSGLVSSITFDATRLGDDEGLPAELAGTFEAVLVDAPCSGTGTMRRHPEIAWALDAAAVEPAGELPALQLGLLKAAAARVAPGGTLVYATCSVLAAENDDVVEAFLASEEGEGFERADILDAPGVRVLDAGARALVASCRTEAGAFRSVPRDGSFDGHFCARLVRTGA